MRLRDSQPRPQSGNMHPVAAEVPHILRHDFLSMSPAAESGHRWLPEKAFKFHMWPHGLAEKYWNYHTRADYANSLRKLQWLRTMTKNKSTMDNISKARRKIIVAQRTKKKLRSWVSSRTFSFAHLECPAAHFSWSIKQIKIYTPSSFGYYAKNSSESLQKGPVANKPLHTRHDLMRCADSLRTQSVPCETYHAGIHAEIRSCKKWF